MGALLQKADILITDCAILPMDGQNITENGVLTIKDGRITYVGKGRSTASILAERRIDGKGKVALPGLINCHTHVPMTLFRGIAEDKPLNTWLKKIIWPLEAKLRSEDVYDGALLGCLEMIRSGTTCFADVYFYEDKVARAVEKSGLRAVLAEGVVEAGDEALGEKMFRKSVNFARQFNGYAEGRVITMLGPHAAYSCSPELLGRIRENACELHVGIHLHMAESKKLFERSRRKYGAGEVEFLDKIGFLGKDVLAAHCIDLSAKDRRILFKRGVDVAHAPVANMKLGLGAARIKDLIDLGINVGLGTDGPASNNSLDMFETVKFASLLQKLTCHDPKVLPAYEVLKMATINGAKALGLEKDIGSLEVGKKADIILVDLSKPHLRPVHSICANLVYSARGGDVDTVIVDGRILMENRQVKSLDEQPVMDKAERTASDLVSR